jgi:flagellar biosynthesis/type III secretory pathway protein FliH
MLMDTRRKTVFSDKLTLLFIETKKFKKTENELQTALDKWIYLLKNVADLMEQPKCISEPIFIQFLEQAEIARFSPDERRRYDASMMAYRDVENSVDTARQDGFKEGRESGLKEGHESGLKEGRESGLKEGRESGLMEAVTNLMQTLGWSEEQAMEALRIPQNLTKKPEEEVTI